MREELCAWRHKHTHQGESNENNIDSEMRTGLHVGVTYAVHGFMAWGFRAGGSLVQGFRVAGLRDSLGLRFRVKDLSNQLKG